MTAEVIDGSGARKCDLCGASVGRALVELPQGGRRLSFCCHGCRMVFEILFNRPEGPPEDYRATALYRACVEAGIVPAPPWEHAPPEPRKGGFNQEPETSNQKLLVAGEGAESPGIPGDSLAFTFHVAGMWCTTCAVLVESVLRRTRGVVDAGVSFFSDSAQVRYLPGVISPPDILDRVSRLGYAALPDADDSETARERKSLQIRLGVAAILTANIMMIAWGLYFGFFEDLGEDDVRTLSWPLWLLSTPVVFYAGAPILSKAIRGIRWGAVSMETLIAIGCLSAYFFSIHQMISGSPHVYFDTASMLVTLVLLGKSIEAGARDNVSRGVTELLRAAGGKVRVIRSGRETWIPGGRVSVGEVFLVREGERVPIDGEIAEGAADVDDSCLTGESRPASRQPPDEILNGSLVLNGALLARVLRPVRDSLLQQMISVIQEALAAKVPAEEMADRVIRWIVPSVVVLASITGAWVWAAGGPFEEAWRRGLSVLVITCPCALGIAIPLAKVATIGAGKVRGLIVRDLDALERIDSLNAFVFDKTGTVTEGVFTLRGIEAPFTGETEVLRRLGAVEACSGHLIAREIARQCTEMGIEPGECSEFQDFQGMGVRGIVDGREIRVGNRRFMNEGGYVIAPELDEHALRKESQGMTTPFFAWDGRVRGFLWLGDAVRAGSLEAIAGLQAQGARVLLVSGDSSETTRSVADALRIGEFMGAMRPADKAGLVKSLQREGLRVAMVGDGINDAPALSLADVAFTVGSGASLPRQVSAVTLLKGELSGVLDAMSLSRLHGRIAAQNLFFAFAYNGLAIPVAMAGFLNPIMAVVAMFLSSITVIANTSRITRSAPADGTPRRQ
ncbi:MAG: cation-translocating P-type ATPase [Syntrophobacteraceae bacterium]|nr:cation-translocating P-type ATPase [Syntrophobacteraceae bacterium]